MDPTPSLHAANPPTYSAIIAAADFVREMNQHLYIPESDRVLHHYVREAQRARGRTVELVEIGCGPMRWLDLCEGVPPRVRYVGVDHDASFLEAARGVIQRRGLSSLATAVAGDALGYRHDRPIDIAMTQGVHHHLRKGEDTRAYLRNIVEQLAPDGLYLLSDEFIPAHTDEASRRRNCVVWYAHVIGTAQAEGLSRLAAEEALTLLDDLEIGQKTLGAVDLVLAATPAINTRVFAFDVAGAQVLAGQLLARLDALPRQHATGVPRLDLDRGDFKVCAQVVEAELAEAGLRVVRRTAIGPVETVGGFLVYQLTRA